MLHHRGTLDFSPDPKLGRIACGHKAKDGEVPNAQHLWLSPLSHSSISTENPLNLLPGNSCLKFGFAKDRVARQNLCMSGQDGKIVFSMFHGKRRCVPSLQVIFFPYQFFFIAVHTCSTLLKHHFSPSSLRQAGADLKPLSAVCRLAV